MIDAVKILENQLSQNKKLQSLTGNFSSAATLFGGISSINSVGAAAVSSQAEATLAYKNALFGLEAQQSSLLRKAALLPALASANGFLTTGTPGAIYQDQTSIINDNYANQAQFALEKYRLDQQRVDAKKSEAESSVFGKIFSGMIGIAARFL